MDVQFSVTAEGFEESQIKLFEKLKSSYELNSDNVEAKKVKLLEVLHESFVIIQYEEESPNN